MPDHHRPIDFDALAAPFVPASEADWRGRVTAVLKGEPFESLIGRTSDELPIGPLYPRRADAPPVPGMRPARPWTIISRVDQPDPETANGQALSDLEGGAGGLTLVFSGTASARGAGLPLGDVRLLDIALSGVDLNLIDLRLDSGTNGIEAVHLLQTLVERRNLSADTLAIDFGLDPVIWSASPRSEPSRWPGEGAAAVVKLSDAGFRGPFLRCDGRLWHEAGASEAQELACLVATGLASLKALEAAGFSLHDARRALSFLAVADHDALLTIAKLRALRRLWARVEKACSLTPEPIRLHAETAWRMLTKRDVNTNMLRNTIAVFAAGIGGADSICSLPFTSALGTPDAFARRIARNTQSVLIEEANLWRVSDPASGAGGFEAMTEALCMEAWALFQTIERQGGMAASLHDGTIQKRITETRSARHDALAKGEATIVGTTRFSNSAEDDGLVLSKAGAVGPEDALASLRIAEPFESAGRGSPP